MACMAIPDHDARASCACASFWAYGYAAILKAPRIKASFLPCDDVPRLP